MKKKLISFFLAFLVLFGLSSQVSQASVYVKPTTQAKTGTLVLVKRDAETNKAIPGAYFRIFNQQGKWVYSISSNGAAYDPENGNIYTTGIQYMYGIQAGTYYMKEVTAPNGYELLSEKIPFTITANKTTTLTVKNKAKATTGSLDITKTDVDTGAVLSGANFTVTDSSGVSQTATTDTNGKASFSNLKAGEVTIKETKAPAGYVANATASKATIEVSKETAVTITNKKEQLYGSLKITKTDAENGTVLSGASFSVTDTLGKTQSGTTDASGNVVFSNLATGTVSIKETKAPAGYIAVTAVPNATITANKQTAITVENNKEKQFGSIKITKVDASSGKVLSGAEFKVTDSQGNVFNGTTDSKGVLIFDSLAVGSATIKETKAPAGYIAVSSVPNATISANKQTAITVENNKEKQLGSLKIIKVDANSDKVLSGAEFKVTDSQSNVFSGTTDANGVLVLNGLAVGSATIEETKAPFGYVLSSKKTTALIAKDFERTVVIENEQVKLEVNAVDESGSPVSDAEFLVYSGGKAVSGFTDANGKFTTSVSMGNGYAYSLTSPENLGFDSIDQTQIKFKVENGETIKVVTFTFSGGGGA